MKRRTFYYIVVMAVLTVTIVLCAIEKNYDYIRLLAIGIVSTSSVYLVPDEKTPPIEVKGVIQYDCKNYDSIAIRVVFYEEPTKLMHYDQITLKVDNDADLRDSTNSPLA